MPDEILNRLRRFHNRYFLRLRWQFQSPVGCGQHPTALFIGCCDSRPASYLLTSSASGRSTLPRPARRMIRSRAWTGYNSESAIFRGAAPATNA